MKHNEAEQLTKRVEAYHALNEHAKRLRAAMDSLEAISGNASEVRIVQPIVLNRGDKGQTFVEDSDLTDYEIRTALLPLIKKKRDAILEKIEAL